MAYGMAGRSPKGVRPMGGNNPAIASDMNMRKQQFETALQQQQGQPGLPAQPTAEMQNMMAQGLNGQRQNMMTQGLGAEMQSYQSPKAYVPTTAGGLQAQPQQQNLERLSPGVYRNAQGQLVNAQGGRLPTPAPQQPQMGGMMQQPMANRPTPFNMDQFKMMLPHMNPGVAAGLGNPLVNTGYFTQPGQRLPMAPDATIRPAVMPNFTMPNFTMPTFNK
jgi:hypothetical protein